MNATESLADFVLNLQPEDIPEKVLQNAARSFTDTMACAFVGAQQPSVRALLSMFSPGTGEPHAPVIGTSARLPLMHAALVNGTAAHALDYDDTFSTLAHAKQRSDNADEGMTVGHLGSCVWPVVAALSEGQRVTGAEALTAYTAGFEVACRLGYAIGKSHYNHGYHSTSTLGCFAATATAGKLLGLDQPQMLSAFSIAASQASGLRGNFGSDVKPLQAGNAARTGIFATQLANRNFVGVGDIVGADLGFLHVLGLGKARDPQAVNHTPAGGFYLHEGNTIKFLPCGNALQGIVECMLELINKNAVQPDQIATINAQLTMPRYRVDTDDGVSYRYPKSGTAGKFNLRYSLAAATVDGRISLWTYTDESVVRDNVRQRFDHTHLSLNSNNDEETLTVTLKNGTELTQPVGPSKGHWSMPFAEDLMQAKFLDCAQAVLDSATADALYASLRELRHCSDLQDILKLAAVQT